MILITTENFGDVFGKSYLLLTQNDFGTLIENIGMSKDPKVDFRMEFMKEVDNIISAAVITKLSNHLKIKMYGDIPIWVGPESKKIDEPIKTDFQDKATEIYLNTISFTFEKNPSVKPLFVWAIDSNIAEKMKEKAVH